MPEVAEKLKPLYFQQGERVGGNTLLPKELRFKILKSVRDLADGERDEVWGLPRRLSRVEHCAVRWVMAYSQG